MVKRIRSDKKTFFGIKANGTVCVGSLLIIVALVVMTLVIGKPIEGIFANTQRIVSNNVGWFFILLVNIVLIFILYLGFGKFRKIKIGGKDAKPDFSKSAWFAMLFSAGMGIGLLFWSVSEPIYHFNSNPFINSDTSSVEAVKSAMGLTFMHWGLHAWGLYAFVALALAFFTFNKKLPLTIRSVFYPILGDRVYGPIGDIIDTISVIATIFGLATSLGFGVKQINAGLEYVFNVPNDVTIQVVLIVFITILAILSLVMSLDKGIRLLSVINMRIALFLLVFVFLVGPTVFLLKGIIQNCGFYASNFLELSF